MSLAVRNRSELKVHMLEIEQWRHGRFSHALVTPGQVDALAVSACEARC